MHAKTGLIVRLPQDPGGGQPLLDKFRVQLPLILLLTVGIQWTVALVLRGSLELQPHDRNAILLGLVANLAAVLSYRRMRLYPGARRFSFIAPSFLLAWAGLMLLLLISREPYSVIQIVIGFAGGLGFTLVLVARMRRADVNPLMFVSSPRVDRMLKDLPTLRYVICRTPEELAQSPSAIVADLHEDLPVAWERAIANAALSGRTIYHVKQLRESLTGKVQIDHLSENAFGTLAPDHSYAFVKLLIERAIAALALVVLLPLLVITGLAIRLETPGPAIFRQARVGFRGKTFTIYKLRTMSQTTPADVKNADITLENDPRITRLGRWLRDLRIDEIPQLANVVLGQMSLIGPRPETVKLSQWYHETLDFYPYRHVVLPGITGWAQVNQGHVAELEDVFHKLQYDFYYIKHYSLWLDIIIAMKTVTVMLGKIGAR